jgi:quercetin dioxygenase-like cupin family protein
MVGPEATGREEVPVASPEKKSLDQPDESRPIDNGKVEVVSLPPGTMMRTTFEPGWQWSKSVKPVVGGDSCQVDHFGYCVSGRLHVVMNDGEEFDVGAGEASHIPPGHDAWVVGDEPYIAVDFSGAAEYAKPSS